MVGASVVIYFELFSWHLMSIGCIPPLDSSNGVEGVQVSLMLGEQLTRNLSLSQFLDGQF